MTRTTTPEYAELVRTAEALRAATAARDDAIRAFYAKCGSLRAVADAAGISHTAVARIVDRARRYDRLSPAGADLAAAADRWDAALAQVEAHRCHTADGVAITVGLRVIDYDARQGTVVTPPEGYELADRVCWPAAGHNGHWWGVCPDEPGHEHGPGCRGKSFDGSRLTTRGVK